MGVQQIQSGLTRAILARKARAGEHSDILLREKRMGDLAWQMTVAEQKLRSCPREKRRAKEYLQKLYDDCLLYTSPSPRDGLLSRMPSSA